MIVRSLTATACLTLVGCGGPLTTPMVDRLEPEAQQSVDKGWANMLSPYDRVDRLLLLDVMIASQLHQRGVDRLRMTSEKDVDGWLVVMTVVYDRGQPDLDEFAVSVIDETGSEIRHESYSREEIEKRIQYLFAPSERAKAEWNENGEVYWVIDEEAAAARHRRHEQILAATQPADDP